MFSNTSSKLRKFLRRSSTIPAFPDPSGVLQVPRHYQKLNIQPVKLFALIIGINEYQHYKPHLKGAVKDANEIEYFLIDCLSVPPNRITKLLDGAATKQRIIEEFQSLCAHGDNQPDTGDAILIYFAGHGARVPAPEGWDSGEIETICPVDMSLPDAPEPQITGIPDIVLNELISQLAEQKGNNITIILDCCHASNGIRDVHVSPNVRGIDKPPLLSGNWDSGIMLTRGKATKGKHSDQSLDCSVLLAACGRNEKAGEDSLGGFFTQCLLQKLEGLQSNDLLQLSYNGLMRLLVISQSRQNPQCESSHSNRYLFRKETEDQSYIFGFKDDDKFVLEAGEIHGIHLGAEFDAFTNNSLSPDNDCRIRFQVAEVNKRKSYLKPLIATSPSDVLDQFYALQTSLAEDHKIKVYCSDCTRLGNVFLQRQSEFTGYATLVSTLDKAAVLVSFDGDCMCFDWHKDNIISKYAGPRIGSPVPIHDKATIIRVFQAVARFNYYLYLEGDPDTEFIQLSLQHMIVKTDKIDGKVRPVRTPIGNNLLEHEPAIIEIEKDKTVGPLVLTICNSSDKELYPNVLWFEGRTLAIDPWYTSQRGAGLEATATVDAPLRACQDPEKPEKFPVGYGEVPVQPWEFLLEDGHPDVGFFKVFLATFNANISSLAQASPFDKLDPRHGRKMKVTPADWWGTQVSTIVQRVKADEGIDTKNKITED